MYNTQFKVKYNDIETELIEKLKNKSVEETEEYSNEDILDVCNKLYRDELLSVFGIEDTSNDIIEQCVKHVYDIMIVNQKFKDIINEMAKNYTNEEVSFEQQDSINQFMFMNLFSQPLFHITHQCICQQIDLGIIDDQLLRKVEEKVKENICI